MTWLEGIEGVLGGPKSSTTTSTTEEKPTSNTGLIIAGILLAGIAVVGLVWLFGGFKPKTKTAQAQA